MVNSVLRIHATVCIGLQCQMRSKVAVHVWLPSIKIVVGLVLPLQSPLQPTKVELPSAVALIGAFVP
jgi:hypothetical protein